MLAASVDVKALAVAAGVAGVVFFVSQRLYVWYRLKKAPGARALILSENPISSGYQSRETCAVNRLM